MLNYHRPYLLKKHDISVLNEDKWLEISKAARREIGHLATLAGCWSILDLQEGSTSYTAGE